MLNHAKATNYIEYCRVIIGRRYVAVFIRYGTQFLLLPKYDVDSVKPPIFIQAEPREHAE